jgi:hypothetical protein
MMGEWGGGDVSPHHTHLLTICNCLSSTLGVTLHIWQSSSTSTTYGWAMSWLKRGPTHTWSVRKLSDHIFLCEHLMEYNVVRLQEPTLNLSAHA